jgi:bifunctional non-homologous end joining protein LigD
MPASEPIRTRVAGRELSVINLDKVMYPATGFTKAEVISYYSQIAEVLLPTSPTARSPGCGSPTV